MSDHRSGTATREGRSVLPRSVMRPSSQPTDIVPYVTASHEPAELGPFEDLLDVLDLKTVGAAHISVDSPGDDESDLGDSDADIFVGRSQPMPHGRVFGGQVLAQSVIAAGRTVEEGDGGPRHIHSLHGYFLRPGDSSHPIRFAVERLRDGRSFSARRVHAIQFGKPILSMIASFQDEAPGLDHQDPMPDVPAPDELPTTRELLGHIDHPVAQYWARERPMDLRHVQSPLYWQAARERVARNAVGMRTPAPMPDDPLLHRAVLGYASDYTLLESVLRKHGGTWAMPGLKAASLDHAMWWHRPV